MAETEPYRNMEEQQEPIEEPETDTQGEPAPKPDESDGEE